MGLQQLPTGRVYVGGCRSRYASRDLLAGAKLCLIEGQNNGEAYPYPEHYGHRHPCRQDYYGVHPLVPGQ